MSEAEKYIDKEVDNTEDKEDEIGMTIGSGNNKICKVKKVTVNPSSIIDVIKEGNRKIEHIN